MAILFRYTEKQIKERFTHYGLFGGFVPVYMADTDTDCPLVETRNWCPDWLLTFAEFIENLFSEDGFNIMITGEIEK